MNMFTEPPEIPLGLGMSLMKHPPAMDKYVRLTAGQKRAMIARTHSIVSTSEMDAFVQSFMVE